MKQAQISCMRAGKLDPKLAHAFLFLGHFFRHQDNMDKALKCYEKALSLSPSDDEIGAALSDLYRVLEKYVSAAGQPKSFMLRIDCVNKINDIALRMFLSVYHV